MTEIDGVKDNVFELRANRDIATIRDLNYLLEKLEFHYSGVNQGALENSFSKTDKKSLAEIFRWMAEYYLNSEDLKDKMPLDT